MTYNRFDDFVAAIRTRALKILEKFKAVDNARSKQAAEFATIASRAAVSHLVATSRCETSWRHCVAASAEVGTLEAGKLADVIVLNADPLADITVLQDPRHLVTVVKDGKAVDLLSGGGADMLEFQRIAAE